MIFSALKLIHVLAVILWVGGMAFAHFFLRPSVQTLEAPVRLRLLARPGADTRYVLVQRGGSPA